MEGGPPRQHPEPQPEDGLRHVFPTPIWTFSFPRADDVNPSLTQGHSRSSPVIPEPGPEQCRRVAVPQRLVSLGGARGEGNWRLDHGLRASSRRSDGRTRNGFAGRSASSAGPASVGRATTTPRTSIPIRPGRGCTTSMRATPTTTMPLEQLSGAPRPAVGRGRSQHPGRSVRTPGSNTAPGRPAHRFPELADALGPPAFRPTGTDRHLVQRRVALPMTNRINRRRSILPAGCRGRAARHGGRS